MVLVQKWSFFQLFFLGNICKENVFYDILERKNDFLGYKNKKFKKSKNAHFSKVVSPWFWSKIGHFSTFFFFTQYRPKKCVLWYSRTKKTLLGYKNKTFKKSEKINIFQRGSSMVWVQNWASFHLCFFRQYRPGKCVLWYSTTKNAFLGNKNKKFKKSKNGHFSKGVSPWFWSKIGHFSTFLFLGNIGQENVFYDILERKNVFLGYKNKKFKKSKNAHFSKGVSP